MTRRVVAALSGGVDSAVAAALAVDAGHDVTGVHLALATAPVSRRAGSRGCCSREDARDAARVADVLGIPFYVWDFSQRFQQDVVEDFLDTYASGGTPNPCLRCNEHIKFGALLDRAVGLGFDAVVTGHHARLDEAGRLYRSADEAKDQSYVLGVLREDQLARTVLPLGGITKEQVREQARRRGLGVADKPDSHDICFVPDGDTAGYLAGRLGALPGPIVDATSGEVLGTHQGTHRFTVGQRRGLDLGVPAPDGRPRFVLSVSPVTRTVTVGPGEALDVGGFAALRPLWTCGEQPLPLACTVQVRAHGERHPAVVSAGDHGWQVQLLAPVRGVAPGQTAVLYDGDRVLGSATIGATSPDH